MSPDMLQAAIGCRSEVADAWAEPLTAAMAAYNIDTPTRQAMFLAQVGHESDLLTRFRENLNYKSSALLGMWPSHFTPERAEQYGRTADHPANQQMIAEWAYGGRMGNGPPGSGDGWNYRGVGPIQLTGKDMVLKCLEAIGMPSNTPPEALMSPDAGALSAAWLFAVEKALLPFADAGDVVQVTRRVNGGVIGLDARRALWERCKGALGC